MSLILSVLEYLRDNTFVFSVYRLIKSLNFVIGKRRITQDDRKLSIAETTSRWGGKHSRCVCFYRVVEHSYEAGVRCSRA